MKDWKKEENLIGERKGREEEMKECGNLKEQFKGERMVKKKRNNE